MILQAVIKLRDPVLSRNRLPGIWTQRSRYTRYIDSTSITTLLTLNYTNPISSNPTSGHAPSKYKLNTFLITQMQNLTFFTILFNLSVNAQFWMSTARNPLNPFSITYRILMQNRQGNGSTRHLQITDFSAHLPSNWPPSWHSVAFTD